MTQQEKKQLREKLRQVIREKQASLTRLFHYKNDEIAKLTDLEKLLTQVRNLPAWSEAHAILLFAPLAHEPNLLALLERPLSHSTKSFFFPRMHDNELELYKWSSPAPWKIGRYGIQEPDPKTWRKASIAEIDLAFIPGLAFDEQGGRLGWGCGYFDRLLEKSEWRALKIGVAWPWQMLPKIPRETHDVIMDFVVTPENIFQVK